MVTYLVYYHQEKGARGMRYLTAAGVNSKEVAESGPANHPVGEASQSPIANLGTSIEIASGFKLL